MPFDLTALRAEIQRAFDECVVGSLEEALYQHRLEQRAADAVVVGQRTCLRCGRVFNLSRIGWTKRQAYCSRACVNARTEIELDGQRDVPTGWARRYGIVRSTLLRRLQRGMPLREAVAKHDDCQHKSCRHGAAVCRRIGREYNAWCSEHCQHSRGDTTKPCQYEESRDD